MNPESVRLRLFLDTGVIVDGCVSRWGMAKITLGLATLRERFIIILAEQIEEEVAGAIDRKCIELPPAKAEELVADVAGWYRHVRLERVPRPSEAAVERALPHLLPVLRHLNDLPAVVAAIEARPDWVISTNRAHWNPALAARSGLRIVTPLEFVRHFARSLSS
jgi:hypothetical protein